MRRNWKAAALVLVLALGGGRLWAWSAPLPPPLKDATGVVFAHPGHFHRIVSLAPSLTEEVFALGAGQELIADTVFGLYPAAARTKIKIGTVLTPDLERIVSLRPDLVLATIGGNREATVDQLRRVGVRVFVTGSATKFEEIQTQFLALARLLGREAQGQAVLRQAQGQIAAVHARVASAPPVRVFFEIQPNPLISASDDTFIGEELRAAGAVNVAGSLPSRYPRLSEASVIVARPEVILVTSEQADPSRAVSSWARFPEVPAVRAHRIYLVPSHVFDSPTPLMFAEAVRIAAGLLHPEKRASGHTLSEAPR